MEQEPKTLEPEEDSEKKKLLRENEVHKNKNRDFRIRNQKLKKELQKKETEITSLNEGNIKYLVYFQMEEKER